MRLEMIDMVTAINKTNFSGVQNVTCWTCRRSEAAVDRHPLDKLYGTPNDEKDDFVHPAQRPVDHGAQVFDKYIAALGGGRSSPD